MTSLTHHTIATNGINLHVVQAGPVDGPLVILLHGFPEYCSAWIASLSGWVTKPATMGEGIGSNKTDDGSCRPWPGGVDVLQR